MERPRYNPQESDSRPAMVIADITSEIDARSHDVALDKATESTEIPKGFFNRIRSFAKNAWKRSGIFYARERADSKKRILESGDLFIDVAGEEGKKAHRAAVEATVHRFSKSEEFEEEFIHKAAGESREKLGNTEAEVRIKTQLQELIRSYARGDISEENFYPAKNRIFAEIKGVKPEAIDQGKMYADNIFEIAKWAKEEVRKQVEQSLDHATAVANLDLDFDVVVGRARNGVRSEAQFNAVDRIVDKIQRGTFGLFNEKTVAVGVAIANTFFKTVVQGSVTRAASAFGIGMAASGAVGAARESRKLEIERQQHAREIAQGKKVKNPTEATRRQELEESRIQTKSVKELEDALHRDLFDKLASKEAKDLTPAEYEQALKSLAEIYARIEISDKGIVKNPKTSKWQFWRSEKHQRIDLIGYSDITKVDQERKELDGLRAKARVELNKWAQVNGHDIRADLNTHKGVISQELLSGEGGVGERNEAFKKAKKEKVWAAFKRSALVGGAIGLAAQELLAFFDGNREGLIEHLSNEATGTTHPHIASEHATLMEGMRRRTEEFLEGNLGTVGSGELHDQILIGHNFKLPEGFDIRPDGSGTYMVFEDGRQVSGSFDLANDGSLTPEAKEYLAGLGFAPHEQATDAMRAMTLEETQAQFSDLERNPRADWHDNPGQHHSNAHNRLIEFEGKQQNFYLEQAPDGTVSVNVKSVLDNLTDNLRERLNDPTFGQNADGSFDQKLIDMKEKMLGWDQAGTLKDHLQVAIIPTEAANDAGLSHLVEGASNGKIALPPEYSSMFTDPSMLRDGQIPFRFMELRLDGHVLATVQGGDIETPIMDTVFGTPNPDHITDPPYIIPWGTRKGLEETERKSEIIYPYYSYSRMSPEERASMRHDMSPRLLANPEAVLDPRTEIEWYFADQERRYPGYVNSLEALNRQIPENMGPNVEAVVALAVAGHQEHKNIYRTLEVYALQRDQDGKNIWSGNNSKFEIDLYINWPSGSTPQETLSEIARFQAKYPKVPIRVVQEEITNGRVEVGLYKKKVFDLALLRHHKRGLSSDIFIIANDADMRYAAPTYLETVRTRMQQSEMSSMDSVLGRQDLDPEVYSKNPTFHAAMRFWQFMESNLRAKHNFIGTQGRNTILRGSSYAAIGGNRTTEFWADIEFGKLFEAARNGRHTMAFDNAAWVMVDPRREIDKFKSGEVIAATWAGDFDTRNGVRGGGRAEHFAPENLNVEALARADENAPETVEFKKRLEEEIRAIANVFMPSVDYYPDSGDSEMNYQDAVKVVEKAADYLGIKINTRPANGQSGQAEKVVVDILDTKKLRERLLEYKTKEKKYTKLRTQPAELNPDTRKKKVEIPEGIKKDFERNPAAYIYGNKINAVKGPAIGLKNFVEGIRSAYGVGDAEFDRIRSQADSLRNRQGFSGAQKELALVIRAASKTNPDVLRSFQASTSREQYLDWVEDVVSVEAAGEVANKNLTVAKIDQMATEFNVPREVIIQGAVNSDKGLRATALRRFDDETRRKTDPMPRTRETMNIIQQQLLDSYLKPQTTRRRAPNRPRARQRNRP